MITLQPVKNECHLNLWMRSWYAYEHIKNYGTGKRVGRSRNNNNNNNKITII